MMSCKPFSVRAAAASTPVGIGVRPTLLMVAVHLAVVGSALLPTPVVHAQAAAHSVVQAQVVWQTRSYDIPSGPLGPVLMRFASESGVLLAATPRLVEGKYSPGVRGSFNVQAALDALLVGTGLTAERNAQGQYALQVAKEDDVITLTPVTVTANQLGGVTEGTGTYTPGAIATATRLVLTPRETPQSISVVTRQEMDDFALTSIDKVMEHTPGVSIVTYDSERTVYFARGFAINNFQYDGIPMERDSGYSAGNTLSDMAIYDRVEVLKGATGLLTGSGDPGATINLIRKKPTHEFQGHVSVGTGTWNNYRTEVDVSGPLNAEGTVRGRAVAAYQDRESHMDGYRRKTPVFYGILETDLSPGTLLTIGADYQDNKPTRSTWGGIPIYDTEGNFNKRSRSFNNGAKWSGWEQYTRTAFATLEHYFDNDWVAKLQLNHQVNGYDAPLGAVGGGNPDPTDGSGTSMWVGRYVGKTRANAADFYASGPFDLFGRKHELVLGGSISNRRWTNKGDGPNIGYPTSVGNFYEWNGNVPQPNWNDPAAWHGENDETTREKGVYSTARWNLRDDLKLITGVRLSSYKRESMKESGVAVPYLGLVYDLNDTYSAYGSYTGIFKPQNNRDESGSTLDPLEGINMELGLKGTFFGGRLNASAAIFQLEQDNFAEATGGLTPDGGTAYRAISGVKSEGYELELSGQLNAYWNVHASYSHGVSRHQVKWSNCSGHPVKPS
ncbi:TonB-dependent siderophore receptor [Ectothiorhodospira shaposhnikovii]|uniref:TonB-dependent siderophore receptor n=1 Tax=Ectothiorhodospira shaposhnikovii TaxID=1054 RepID=UPI001907E9A8|nr:TonB-dependent siderophore receptor [Ectothiorhodospira shaposhnikovii]